MIIVRRLTGQQFAINPDLLGRIESTPDTILVLLDGTRYIVDQTVDEVVALIRQYRASVIAQAMQDPAPLPGPTDKAAGARSVVPLPSPSKEN